MHMKDTRENAQQFYEVLTGVFNDEQSKITRIVCFAVLLFGMLWGGFNYYRATVLADTSTPIDGDLFQDNYMPGNDASLNRIVDLAQAVDAMKLGGDTLAAAIDSMNRMPFNLDPAGQGGLDPVAALGTNVNQADDTGIPGSSGVHGGNEPQPGPLVVKMIMTTNGGQRIAVVDAGGKKAVVVKRGDKLPGEQGFVSSIRPEGITVIFNKKEVKYEIPEISKFEEIK